MKYENLNDVAQSLTSSNYELIVINLVITCLAIVGVYIHSRLKKSAELAEINQNFTKVLDQQKTLTEETGKIKLALDKDSINFQIKLSSYNENSIDAINSIYTKLIELRNSAKSLGFNPNQEEKDHLLKTVSAFRQEYDTKRIWLPSDLSEHIEEVAIDIDNRSNNFIIANMRADNITNLSEAKLKKIFEAQEGFSDYLNKEIEPIFNTLVKKISDTVGAQKA